MENQLGLVMAQEELELIWTLENDFDRVIPRESEKETSDIEKKEKFRLRMLCPLFFSLLWV